MSQICGVVRISHTTCRSADPKDPETTYAQHSLTYYPSHILHTSHTIAHAVHQAASAHRGETLGPAQNTSQLLGTTQTIAPGAQKRFRSNPSGLASFSNLDAAPSSSSFNSTPSSTLHGHAALAAHFPASVEHASARFAIKDETHTPSAGAGYTAMVSDAQSANQHQRVNGRGPGDRKHGHELNSTRPAAQTIGAVASGRKFKGVSETPKNGKYECRVYLGRVPDPSDPSKRKVLNHYVGRYETAEKAAYHHDLAAIQHGISDSSRLNFPELFERVQKAPLNP